MLKTDAEIIPGYRLEKFLGRGQFGEVWKSTAPGGTWAALKFIDLEVLQGHKEFRGVQRVKEIRHAHLMPITAMWMVDRKQRVVNEDLMASFDTEARSVEETCGLDDVTDSHLPRYLVVAMLLGDCNLQDKLEECQHSGHDGIPADTLLRYMEEAARGIDFLNAPVHDLGEGPIAIQHCDIKPANIMLIGDSVVVCDFGLARMLSEQSISVTATGMIGSPAYMAPECIRKKTSHSTDQYSLAITYYELRTGNLPFKDQSYLAVLDAHRSGDLVFPRVSEAEAAVLEKATAVEPTERYETCEGMVIALRQAIQSQGKDSTAASGDRSMSVAGIVSVAAIVFVICGLLFAFLGPERAGVQSDGSVSKTITAKEGVIVTVNGELLDRDSAGSLTASLSPTDRIDLVAMEAADEDSGVYRTTFAWDEFATWDGVIQLPRSGLFYSKQADEFLQQDDSTRAAAAVVQAIKVGGVSFARPTASGDILEHEAAVSVVCVLSNGRVVTGDMDSRLVLTTLDVDLHTSAVKHSSSRLDSEHEGGIASIARSSTSDRFVSLDYAGKAYVWSPDASSKAMIAHPLRSDGDDSQELELTSIAVDPKDSAIVVAGDSNGVVRVWRVGADGRAALVHALDYHQTQTPDGGDIIDHVKFSADGKYLYSTGIVSGNTYRWSSANWTELPQRVPGGGEAIRDVALSNGDTLAAVYERTLAVIESNRGLDGNPQLLQLALSPGEVLSTSAFTSDGSRLVTGSSTGKLRIWNSFVDQAPAASEVIAHRADTSLLRISQDSKWLVSAGFDNSVILWFLTDFAESPAPLPLPGCQGNVEAAEYSADGRFLITGDGAGKIKLWDLRKMEILKTARQESGYKEPIGAADTIET